MVSEPLPSLRWGEHAQAHEGWQRGRWVLRGGDCGVPHRLGMEMCIYMYIRTISDTTRFKALMANLKVLKKSYKKNDNVVLIIIIKTHKIKKNSQ
jgi:hypothetical protein